MRTFVAQLVPAAAVLFALAGIAVGCSSTGGGGPASFACLPALPRECTPLYDPTFDNLFKNRLGPTCGAVTTGGSCHSEQGARAGLVLQSADVAYDHLLGKVDGKKRVLPNDPECSLLMERIDSNDAKLRMPPGQAPLTDAERCAFALWIAEGAKR